MLLGGGVSGGYFLKLYNNCAKCSDLFSWLKESLFYLLVVAFAFFVVFLYGESNCIIK